MEHALNGNRRTERWKWLTLAAVLAVVSFGCGETESAGSSPAVDAGAGGSAAGGVFLFPERRLFDFELYGIR